MRALALALLLPLAASGATAELSQGVEALSGGRPAWRVTALDLAWRGEPGAAAGLGLRELSRSSRDDVDGAAWGQAPLAGFVLGLEASASPTYRFVPRWSGGARAERGLGAGWVLSAGARVLRYEGDAATTTATIASAGVERYWGAWRAAATTSAVALEREWSASERLALDRFYGEEGRVGVAAALGRELEHLGGGRVLRTEVVAAGLAGAHPVGAAWAVTWELGVHRQGDLYTRAGGRLGLRRRF